MELQFLCSTLRLRRCFSPAPQRVTSLLALTPIFLKNAQDRPIEKSWAWMQTLLESQASGDHQLPCQPSPELYKFSSFSSYPLYGSFLLLLLLQRECKQCWVTSLLWERLAIFWILFYFCDFNFSVCKLCGRSNPPSEFVYLYVRYIWTLYLVVILVFNSMRRFLHWFTH